jgi:hypothetical protein
VSRLHAEVQGSDSRSDSKMLRRGLLLIAPLALCLSQAPAPAAAQNASPACSTFDTRNQKTNGFRAGEAIVIRGIGFGMRSAVVATFRQGVRAAELGRVQTSDLGAFSIPDASIPDTAEPGSGSLVVVDGPRSATCDLTIEAGSPRGAADSDAPTVLFIAWGIALAIVAALLAFITLRRWQRGRLHRAMADLPQGQDDLAGEEIRSEEKDSRGTARVPWLELDDVEIVELGTDELGSTSPEEDDLEDEEDVADLTEDELQDLIDELEEDHEEVDEGPSQPQRRRVVHRERPEREQDPERLIPVTVPPEEPLDEPDETDEAPQPPPRRRRPRPLSDRPGSNVDRLRDAVKDWQTRSTDDS